MAEPVALPPGDSAPPDIMNDPQFATNIETGDDGTAEVCRICRGEGSDNESLFHPCKCSGSIKYVHQDCLMEWLSHSQKKHCELCKTPFRFTKLYHPNMPQSLPFPVLAKHSVVHFAKNLATWLRFAMVLVVWLACLPYSLRQFWRVLFWLSDVGWPSSHSRLDHIKDLLTTKALEVAREIHSASNTSNGTSPSTPLHATQTTPASVGGLVEKLFALIKPGSQIVNTSHSSPLATGLFNSLFYGLGNQGEPDGSSNETNILDYASVFPDSTSNQSLLSDVVWLRNLTRNPYVNGLVIQIMEGYIITILVVVCFILVFLIREWVVQQQPGINMGAGFAAEAPGAERPRGQLALPEFRPPPREEDDRRVLRNEDQNVPVPEGGQQDRPAAHVRRRNVHFGDGENINPPVVPVDDADPPNPDPGWIAPPQTSDVTGSSSQSRPAPPREAFSPAVEIQRRLTEEPRMTEEFLAIWRRADSKPREVLRIIESENKSEEMAYWVNAMKMLEDDPSDTSADSIRATQGSDFNDEGARLPGFALPGPRRYSLLAGPLLNDGGGSSASSESWVEVPKSLETSEPAQRATASSEAVGEPLQNIANRKLDKGKQRAEDPPEELAHPSGLANNEPDKPTETTSVQIVGSQLSNTKDLGSLAASPSRPRAQSDGPQRNENMSLLANNNWTFPEVREESTYDGRKAPEWTFSNLTETPKSGDILSTGEKWTSDKVGSSSREDMNSSPLDQASSQPTDEARRINIIAPPRMTDEEIHQMENSPIEVTGEDGTVRTYANIEELFAANPVEPDTGDDNVPDLAPDGPIPEQQEPVVPPPAAPVGLWANVADVLWGGVGNDGRDEPGDNDEHIVQDLAAEAPFVPVGHDALQPAAVEQDREVMAAAIAAGLDPNDQDVIDDAEDFEGIMELVGMRGPIFSLFQNAVFSAFLLALAVAVGVWIPYNLGRVSLLLMANPISACKVPLRWIFLCAAFLQDLVLTILGGISYLLIILITLPISVWCHFIQGTNLDIATGILAKSNVGPTAGKVSVDAMGRIINGTLDTLSSFSNSDIFTFSAASHEALNSLKSLIINTIDSIGATFIFVFTGNWKFSPYAIGGIIGSSLKYNWNLFTSLPALLMKPDTWVISLEVTERVSPLDLDLSVWDGWSRFWAVFTGYAVLCVVGILYVNKGSPFSSSQTGREWEAAILDLLNQAGGVMKVILIISIEMLVFPLYCGLLLDVALLPLFENATVMSRINFTVESPFTSMFVHWFVGTCYMFHFALFVSMCRKIMRKGVLYFIRDPDDPTFHPVRDVLERNVATQLRKILFSALVYGAMVVVCLGGVVWGLALAFKSVLPIHWSSNEPVLEFPIDLLFYNFVMPLAVRFFKPSAGLHAMYTWWFRQCARMLRLTWFMFDERKLDEEGYHVRRNWTDLFRGIYGDPALPVDAKKRSAPFLEDSNLKAYFCRNGRYVRAPASDQVRIPKGGRIFLNVDAANDRVDGKWDRSEGVHGRNNALFKQVYIPPFFQFRICLFILFIWLFAACTGVGITIVPLVFGRYLFAKFIPPHVRKNDVYAFSIGIYILGSALYAILHVRQFITWLRTALEIDAETPHNVLRRVTKIASRIGSIAWTYSAFLFVLPTLSAFVVEFYLILPLHTYFSAEERHIVHFVQSWTLGLLYVKLTTRIILWHAESRPAQSLRAVTRNGYLNPDARLATRSFILPGVFLLSTALSLPYGIARAVVGSVLRYGPEMHLAAYRYAYPVVLAAAIIIVACWRLAGMIAEWRISVRDEVYLIGERLHNFGERKGVRESVESVGGASRRIEAAGN